MPWLWPVLWTSVATLSLVGAGALGLAALEARLLDPRRGVVGTLARAARLAATPLRPSADHALGVAAAVLATSLPTAAAALLIADVERGSLHPVGSGLLCLTATAPLLAAVAAGVDERARLGLYDALASTTRRLLALVACAVSTSPAALLAVAPWAVFVLVRGRHRGAPTLLPRWEDALSGRLLLVHRLGERAGVVAVAIAAGAAVRALVLPAWSASPAAAFVDDHVFGVTVVAVVVAALGAGAVVATRVAGPLRGEGVLGPLWLLAAAAALRLAG